MIEIDNPTSPARWWRSKRIQYNKGLLWAGLVAFALYCVLGPIFIAPHEEFEETLVEIIFQGVGYLIMMGIANLFYTLGWLSDVTVNRRNSQRFRERLFAVGFWFSVALPPLVILSVMARFYLYGS